VKLAAPWMAFETQGTPSVYLETGGASGNTADAPVIG